MNKRIHSYVRRGAIVVVATIATVLSIAIPANAYDVVGAIRVEYDQVGGAAFFGNPLFNERDALDGGKFQDFQKQSSIYWHPTRTGGNKGRQIGGDIRTKWGSFGYERGFLGYPTTRETATRKPGRFNAFENGSIYWSSATGAHAVTGEIYQTWAANDWENGSYGFPTGDEYDYQGGRRQDFQGGQIVYHPGGFPEDWAGDEDGTDAAPDCGAAAACGTDGRGGGVVAAQQLPTLTPGSGPRSTSRSAQSIADCSVASTPTSTTTPAPASSTPPAPVTSTQPTSQTPRTRTAPGSSSAASETTVPSDPQREQSDTNPPAATVPTETPTPPSSAAPSSAQPSTTSSPQAVASGATWCRTVDKSAPPAQPRLQRRVAGELDGTDPLCTNGDRRDVWMGNRQDACYQSSRVTFTLRDRDLKEIGEINGYEYARVVPTWNQTKWSTLYLFEVGSVTGQANGAVMTVNQTCRIVEGSGNCDGSGQDSTVAEPNHLLRVQQEYTSAPAAGAVLFAQVINNLTITSVNSVPYAGPVQAARVRCDAAQKMRNTTGCVIGDEIPVWDISSTPNIDDYRRHVTLAQQSGIPGAANNAGDGTVLTRKIDQSEINKRRNITCGGVTGPRTGGRSCDEYPMASTFEGGGNGVGAGVGRTFTPFCGIRDTGLTSLADVSPPNRGAGYSACLIPASQNSRAGSLQSWFYTKARVIDGDAFRVRPQP